MVLMGVSEDDCVQMFSREVSQLRETFTALVFGVGTAIQDDAMIASLKKVAVCANFDLAGEVGKAELRHEEWTRF